MNATATAKLPCSCKRLGVNCGGTTWNVFAQGHDAKMKGMLQVAHRSGQRVRLDGRFATPMQAAMKVAPNLARFLDAA